MSCRRLTTRSRASEKSSTYPTSPAAATEALKFFKWAFANGDKMAQDLDYIPLPDAVVQRIEASWKEIKGVNP